MPKFLDENYSVKASSEIDLDKLSEHPVENKPALDISAFTRDSLLEFGYCTECLLRLQTSKVKNVDDFDINIILDYLKGIGGESVVAFKEDSMNEGLIADKVTFNADIKVNEPVKCQAKIRSAQQPKDAVIKLLDNGKVEVIFEELQNPIAIGQSAVFYNNDTVLGGGIIESAF